MSVATLPKDVGLCSKCEQRNSKSATKCHACGMVLPWVKVPKTKADAVSVPKVKVAAPKIDVGDTLRIIVANSLTFLFCAAAPVLGYFLWKYMDKDGSEYAPIAQIGWILGIVFHIGRFAWKFLLIGASVAN